MIVPSVTPKMALTGTVTRIGQRNTASPNEDSRNSLPELKFVTTTGHPSLRSKESRLVVRSHAMQAFLHDKKTDGNGAKGRATEMPVQSLDESVGRFKLASWSRKSGKRPKKTDKASSRGELKETKKVSKRKNKKIGPSSLSIPVTLGYFEPFGVLPIVLTERTHSLLYHYATSFTMNSLAVNPEGSWMSFALTDAAVLHATLSLVAYHYGLTHGDKEMSLDCLYQKGEAIREINQRLGDSSRQFSDVNVATVALFTNIETMAGTRHISDLHMTALERMVGMRGGLVSFKHNKVLQRVLTWADILYSSTWDYQSRFPLLQPYQINDSITTLERFSSTLTLGQPEYDVYKWCRSNPEMYDILEMLRRISTAATSSDLAKEDRAATSNQIYLLEHALLSFSSSPSALTPEPYFDFDYAYDTTLYNPIPTEPDLSSAFRLAALLYLHLILREIPRTATMHHKLVTHLRLVLETQEFLVLHDLTSPEALELLAWMFFLGATAASSVVDKQYFLSGLARSCELLGLVEQLDVEKMLKGVAWRPGLCDGYFADLWANMLSV